MTFDKNELVETVVRREGSDTFLKYIASNYGLKYEQETGYHFERAEYVITQLRGIHVWNEFGNMFYKPRLGSGKKYGDCNINKYTMENFISQLKMDLKKAKQVQEQIKLQDMLYDFK